MEEEVKKKLKDFDDVFGLIDDMIRHLDAMMNTVEGKAKKSEVNYKGEEKKKKPGNTPKLKI